MTNPLVLLVDDDEKTLAVLGSKFERWGFSLALARSGLEALAVLKQQKISLVISDLNMPDLDGLELLKEVRKSYKNMPFIMLTGYGTVETAVQSLKEGASDFLQKPFEPESLQAIIKRVLAFYKLSNENKTLKSQILESHGWHNIITRSSVMAEAITIAKKFSLVPNNIIALYGESGTGKDMLAKSIHFESESSEGNFVQINCAGIPATLLESELFGYVKGSFTGADHDKEGKFDYAQKGTIFLDEIGDMPMELQAKLLLVLQERAYEKIGSNKKIDANFRIIVATHRNLQEAVAEKLFREDLFHRINTLPISVPPLREREGDVRLLTKYFMGFFADEFRKGVPDISPEALKVLESHSWPGNVRELRNCVARAMILNDGNPIKPDDLNLEVKPSIVNTASINQARQNKTVNDNFAVNLLMPLKECSLDNITNEVLKSALEQCGFNKTKAAEMLKVDRRMFYRIGGKE